MSTKSKSSDNRGIEGPFPSFAARTRVVCFQLRQKTPSDQKHLFGGSESRRKSPNMSPWAGTVRDPGKPPQKSMRRSICVSLTQRHRMFHNVSSVSSHDFLYGTCQNVRALPIRESTSCGFLHLLSDRKYATNSANPFFFRPQPISLATFQNT